MNRRQRGAKVKYFAAKFGVALREPLVKLARTRRWKIFLESLGNGHEKEKVAV